jgi:hypothetical protein
MNKKNTTSPQPASLKDRLAVFIIFFLIISAITSFFAYNLTSDLRVDGLKVNEKSLVIDGADFTPAVYALAGGIQMVAFLFSMAITFVFNLLIVLTISLLFYKPYFQSICLKKAKLEKYVTNIIWGFSAIGVLTLMIITHDMSITLLITSVTCLPTAIMEQVIFTIKSQKAYNTLNTQPPTAKTNPLPNPPRP